MELLTGEHTYRVERDYDQVWAGWTPTRDPSWHFTDAEGHEHLGTDIDLTLEWVVTGQGGCSSDCCPGGETWDEGEYRCRACGEVVVPGTRVDVGPMIIPTGESYYIDDERVTREQWDAAVKELLDVQA